MESTFRLRLLGPVQVERDGEPLRGFRSRKALALLGYLALQEHPIPREHLVDLLWGDKGELLEGMYLDDCADFELWLVGERERWRQRVARVLGELVTHHSRRGEHQQSLRFAQRLLALEPDLARAHYHLGGIYNSLAAKDHIHQRTQGCSSQQNQDQRWAAKEQKGDFLSP